MRRLPSVPGKVLLKSLKKLGFNEIRIKGSHHFLRHNDGRCTTEDAQSCPFTAAKVLEKGCCSKF